MRKNNCMRNFLCWLPITPFVINSKLSDMLNTILYLDPINASHKGRGKQVQQRNIKSTPSAQSVLCVVCAFAWPRFACSLKVTCTGRATEWTKSTQTNKIKQFLFYSFGDCLFWGCVSVWKLPVEFSWFYHKHALFMTFIAVGWWKFVKMISAQHSSNNGKN